MGRPTLALAKSPVFQEPYLFRVSLRENILLCREIPERTYRDVIEKLNLTYLLDEVTSALDQEDSERSERLLLQEDAAVIYVCHKPNPALLPLYNGHFVLTGGILSEKTPA